jgi:hypothetical protein
MDLQEGRKEQLICLPDVKKPWVTEVEHFFICQKSINWNSFFLLCMLANSIQSFNSNVKNSLGIKLVSGSNAST